MHHVDISVRKDRLAVIHFSHWPRTEWVGLGQRSMKFNSHYKHSWCLLPVCVCVSPKSGRIFCPQQRLEDFEGRWLLKLFLADETLCTIYTTFCMQVKTETHACTDFNTFLYLCVCFLLRFVLSFLIKPATVWFGDFKSSLLITERTDEKERGIKKKEL